MTRHTDLPIFAAQTSPDLEILMTIEAWILCLSLLPQRLYYAIGELDQSEQSR